MGRQLLEGEAPESRVAAAQQIVQCRVRGRAVQVTQGAHEVRQAEPAGNLLRQQIGQDGGPAPEPLQCLVREGAPGGLLQPLGGGVDGGQGVGHRGLVADPARLVLGVDHLQGLRPLADLAITAQVSRA